MEIDEELAREIAEEIILSQTEDVEFLSVWEMTSDRPEVNDYTDEELEDLVTAVDDLCGRAEVTVSFRD